MLIKTRQLITHLLADIENSGIDLLTIRKELRNGTRKRDDFREMATSFATTAGNYPAPIQQRIIELLLDALRSEALYPDYLLSPAAITLADVPVIALVFQVYPHIANELYPLLIDGFTAGLSVGGELPFQVLGIHADWLQADDSFRRAICFHEESASLLEADVVGRPTITAAHIFALDLRDEAAIHRQITSKLTGVRLLNPADGAAMLDDKLFTGNCWQAAGLSTPSFVLLSSNESLAEWERVFDEFSRSHGNKLLLKPRCGTEGRGVQLLAGDAPDLSQILAKAHAVAEDLLLMTERGSLYCNIEQEIRPIVIRYNVSWDGELAVAESAYLQLAGNSGQICSVNQGGTIVSLADYQQFFCHADRCSWHAEAAYWRRLREVAETGVAALAKCIGADMPALIGIDILPELADDNKLIPVLLEANGRPAGMGHCRMLTDNGPSNEPGVTQRLFEEFL